MRKRLLQKDSLMPVSDLLLTSYWISKRVRYR